MSAPIGRAMSAAQVAKELGVSPRTLAKWVKAGLVPVWFTDENQRKVFHSEVIAAHQRRSGELAAEARGAS